MNRLRINTKSRGEKAKKLRKRGGGGGAQKRQSSSQSLEKNVVRDRSLYRVRPYFEKGKETGRKNGTL